MPKDPFETDLVRGAKDYLRAFSERRDRPPVEQETQAYLEALFKRFEQERAVEATNSTAAGSAAYERDADETVGARRRQRKRRVRMLLAAFNESVEGRQLRFRVELPPGRDRLNVVEQHPWVKRLLEPFFSKRVRLLIASETTRHWPLPLIIVANVHAAYEAETLGKGWIARGDAALAVAFTSFLERYGVETETTFEPAEVVFDSDVHEIVAGIDAENLRFMALEEPLRFRIHQDGIYDALTGFEYCDEPFLIHAFVARRQHAGGKMVLHVRSRARQASLCLAATLTSDDGIRELLRAAARFRLGSVTDVAEFPAEFELLVRLTLNVPTTEHRADVYAVSSELLCFYDGRETKGRLKPLERVDLKRRSKFRKKGR